MLRWLKRNLARTAEAARKELKDKVADILLDEIATAHTSESGKTSRLTSAYNRIQEL